MGILDDIKSEVKKSGTNKGKILYIKADSKTRVRFLDDLDNGHKIIFHDSFSEGINVPCQEQFGRDCPYCSQEELRTRAMYAWSVYDYESKEVKILLAAVNNCSPIPNLTALNDNYGTLLDRDLLIQRTGTQQNTTYAVIPQDKSKFRNTKAKAFSKSALLKILDKAYPSDVEDDDEEEDETPIKRTKSTRSTKANTKTKTKVEEPEEDDWDDDEEEVNYVLMSALELFKLCKERGLTVAPKKKKDYYIDILEDAEEDNEDDEDEDEDWE